MKKACLVLTLGLAAALLASGAAAEPSGPATMLPSAPLAAGLAEPEAPQAVPLLTCGPDLIEGTYTAYYSDPAKTMFLCEKSCGDTDCTRFTPYFTISQTCCPRIE